MRWYLENSDGPQRFWDATFHGGQVTVRSGALDGESQTEALNFDSADEAIAALRKRIAPMFESGWEQRVPPDERYEPHPRIARFWAEEVLEEWKALGVAPADAIDNAARWGEYLAIELPLELEQYLTWWCTHAFGYCDYGEWRIWDDDRWLPHPEDGNLFEQLLLSDQQNYLGTALMEHFASWVFIGTAGNGDGYYAHPNHGDPNQAEVVFFNHETHSPDFVLADSVASLAWLNHCYRALEAENFDHERFCEDFALLQDRVSLSWHYHDLQEESGIEPSYEGKSRAIYYFYRAIWLDFLLRPNKIDVRDIGDVFYPDIHAPLRFEDALESPYLTTMPITALYWIWRLFWFDRPELEQCLEVTAEHRSPVVRDCVALVRELLAGRQTLGAIEDVFERRAAFLALDLDPDRAEQRAAEEAEASRRTELALADGLKRAHALLAESSVEQVREALWDFADQPEVLDVLYEHLEHHDPDAAPWIRRYDFHRAEKEQEYRFEREEFREVVGAGGGVLAPRFAGPDSHFTDWIHAARTAGDRITAGLIEYLDGDGDKYNHMRSAAIRSLSASGAHEVVPKLIELTETLRWEPSDWEGELYNKKALLAAVEGLAELGGDEAVEPLVALLNAPYPEVHPRVLASLGRMGATSAAPAIKQFLDGEHARPALFALAHLGDVEAVDRHVGMLAGGFAELAYERAMQQLARQVAGAEVDGDVIQLTAVIESKRFEDIELHEALIELLMEHPEPAVARNLITDYLHHEHEELRELAYTALLMRDEEPDLRWLDRPAVDELYQREGVEGLRSALVDRHAMFRHNVLRKAVDEGVATELAEEACDYVRFLTRFEHYTNGYVQDLHQRTAWAIETLAQIDDERVHRLLARLWRGPNPMYRDVDVLKYDRDEIQARLQPYVADVEAELAAAAPPVSSRPASSFATASWLFGACVHGIDWSPDGSWLAVCGEGGAKLFDARGNCMHAFPEIGGAWAYDVAFNPSGSLLAVGAHAGHLWLLDPQSGEQVAKLKGHSGVPCGVRKVRFSPSGDKLASVSDDQTLRIWSVEQHACIAVWEDPADVNTVDWVDEETLVIGSDRMVRLIGLDGEEIASASCSGVAEVRVHHERQRIYVGNANTQVRVFSLDLTEQPSEALDCGAVARIRFRAQDLVAASWEGEGAGVWLLSYNGSSATHLAEHRQPTFALDLHPTSGEIAAGGKPGMVARWTPDGTPVPAEGNFHTDEIASIRFCGDEIVTASDDRSVIRWSTVGEALGVIRTPEHRLCDAIVDGDRVYVCGSEIAACFTLAGEFVWQAQPARAEHLHLTKDALIVASASQLLWLDRNTGDVIHETEPFADSFIYRWIELDESRLAVAGYDDERLFVWDTVTRKLLAAWDLPSAERGGICDVACGGDHVFVSRWDSSIVVIDAKSGALVKRAALPGPRYPIAVSPDGAKLYAAGAGVDVYDTASFEVIERIEVPAALETIAIAPDGTPYFGAKSGEVFVVSR